MNTTTSAYTFKDKINSLLYLKINEWVVYYNTHVYVQLIIKDFVLYNIKLNVTSMYFYKRLYKRKYIKIFVKQ